MATLEFKNLGIDFKGRSVLSEISFSLQPGTFTALLGENGSGKTTLLDLVMGFHPPSRGELLVYGNAPHRDAFETRQKIAYLAEKVDVPGSWSAQEFLEFNRFFYPAYSLEREKALLELFRINVKERFGNMSAGQVRRTQVVGALAFLPDLIIVDEITALFDIVGRRKFMELLQEEVKSRGATVLFATNIIEDLQEFTDRVLLLKNSRLAEDANLKDFLANHGGGSLLKAVSHAIEF